MGEGNSIELVSNYATKKPSKKISNVTFISKKKEKDEIPEKAMNLFKGLV